MKRKLIDILKDRGMFSKEAHTRFQNKQILVHGEPVDKDFEVEVNKIIEADELVFKLCKNPIWAHQLNFIGLENVLHSNVQTSLKTELSKVHIVRTSKKEIFVII